MAAQELRFSARGEAQEQAAQERNNSARGSKDPDPGKKKPESSRGSASRQGTPASERGGPKWPEGQVGYGDYRDYAYNPHKMTYPVEHLSGYGYWVQWGTSKIKWIPVESPDWQCVPKQVEPILDNDYAIQLSKPLTRESPRPLIDTIQECSIQVVVTFPSMVSMESENHRSRMFVRARESQP